MGMDPKDYRDRIKLGDKAYQRGDLIGAVIEYEAAVHLNDDLPQLLKLRTASDQLGSIQDKLYPAPMDESIPLSIPESSSTGRTTTHVQ